MPEVAGSRIGHYVIEAPLGAAGMGEVYVAFEGELSSVAAGAGRRF